MGLNNAGAFPVLIQQLFKAVHTYKTIETPSRIVSWQIRLTVSAVFIDMCTAPMYLALSTFALHKWKPKWMLNNKGPNSFLALLPQSLLRGSISENCLRLELDCHPC